MRYLVAHLLSGDAQIYQQSLARELSFRFHVVPFHERSPAHLTLKPPFETDEAGIADLERILRMFAHGERATPFSIRGFGRFGFRTVYLDVPKSPAAVALGRRLIGTLNGHLPWLPRYPLEGNKLHVSVARFLTRRQSRRIRRFIGELPYPRFDCVFDSITILRKDGARWVPQSTVPFPAERGYAGFVAPARAALAK